MGCLFSRMSRNAACARVDEKTGLLPRNTSASRLPATAARPIASGAALSASAVAARLNGGTQARQQQAAFSAKYDLCQVIGMGSTSVCHRCVERSTKKEFACKVIDKHRVDKSLCVEKVLLLLLLLLYYYARATAATAAATGPATTTLLLLLLNSYHHHHHYHHHHYHY